MQLGSIGSCVGEPSDCRVQPEWPSAPLAPASPAALEGAVKLTEKRGPLARFLLRKSKAVLDMDDSRALAETELKLQSIAAVLAGLLEPQVAVHAAGGSASLAVSPTGRLGDLIGTPRDMSSAAAVQVRAAVAAMVYASPEEHIGKRPKVSGEVRWDIAD